MLASLPSLLEQLIAERLPVPTRQVCLDESMGLVLATDLVTRAPVPERARALRPGYAVRSIDLVGLSSYSPLFVSALPPRVEAGDFLPAEHDAVLPRDCVQASGSGYEIVSGVAPGENTRLRGADAPAGFVIRRAGEVTRPMDIAMAREAGLPEAVVFSFALAVEADETVTALIRNLLGGMRVTSAHDADVTILVGDDPAPILASRAPRAKTIARGLALAGAEDVRVAVDEKAIVIAAPGRLESLVPLVLAFVDPLLAGLVGAKRKPFRRRAPLLRKIASSLGLAELVLLREEAGAFMPLGAGAVSWEALLAADAFLVVPASSEGYAAGTDVEAMRWPV